MPVFNPIQHKFTVCFNRNNRTALTFLNWAFIRHLSSPKSTSGSDLWLAVFKEGGSLHEAAQMQVRTTGSHAILGILSAVENFGDKLWVFCA